SFHAESRSLMSLAILAVGTALPPTCVTQADAMTIARAVCCRTAEQASWLPGLYQGSGINQRHLAFDPLLIQDILDGTRYSGSPFLPNGVDDGGPTSGQRMRHYRKQAPALALAAGRDALGRADMRPEAVTHVITVSCTGFFAPGLDVALIKGLDLRPAVA